MSAFDLATTEADARLRTLLQQPETEPGAFTNFWGSAMNALQAAPLEAARAVSPVLDAYRKAGQENVQQAARMFEGTAEASFDALENRTVYDDSENVVRTNLTSSITRLTPDPRVTGMASQLVFGLVKSAGKAVGYSMVGGPIVGAGLYGLDEGINETMRLEDKGVDSGTAAKSGAVHGVVSGLTAALPIAGKTKLQTAGLVVSGGPSAYVAEQAGIREILRAAQFETIAEEYSPTWTGAIVSTAAPAVFGAAAHGARSMKGEPRGVRNNNPGNIVKTDTPWSGKVEGKDAKFEAFATPEHGIAALARNLMTYAERHGLDTVETIVARWAPPSENKTGRYVAAVAKELGVDPAQKLNLSDPATLGKLTKSIIRQENGKQPYNAQQISTAVESALSGRTLHPAPELVDAARVTHLAQHADAQHLGPLDDVLSRNQHIQAMDAAVRAIDDGEPVRLADQVQITPESLQQLRGLHDALKAESPLPTLETDHVPTQPRTVYDVPAPAELADTFRANIDEAGTPELKAAWQSLIDDPIKHLPSGELDAKGNPIALPATQLLLDAGNVRMNAEIEARGIAAAVTCFLRG